MPGMGAVDAANAVAGVRSNFPSIDMAFLVGICGASQKHTVTQQEIYLGDCIVSTAVIQYDFVRQLHGHFERKKDLEDSLGRAGPKICALLAKLQTPGTPEIIERELAQHLRQLQQKEMVAHCPGSQEDHLYKSAYLHVHHNRDGACNKCDQDPGTCTKDCSELGCEETQLVL